MVEMEMETETEMLPRSSRVEMEMETVVSCCCRRLVLLPWWWIQSYDSVLQSIRPMREARE